MSTWKWPDWDSFDILLLSLSIILLAAVVAKFIGLNISLEVDKQFVRQVTPNKDML